MPRIGYAEGALAPDELEDLAPVERLGRRFAGIWAHRPRAAAAWRTFSQELASETRLPPRLVELVRLRIAFHNQCRSCMALRYSDAHEDGLTEDLVCSLESPQTATDLTEAERAALQVAELFATDHLAITDNVLDDVRTHFNEGEVFELLLHCARMVGFGRLAAVCQVYEDLPAADPSDTPYTPWGSKTLLRR